MNLYLVLNNVVANTNSLKDARNAIQDMIKGYQGMVMCQTFIQKREDYKTAWGEGDSIFATSNNKGKDEFLSLIREIKLDI